MSKNSLNASNFNNPGSFIPAGQSVVAARVKDIILDESHKEYKRYGNSESIGVIKYEIVGDADKQDDTYNLAEAYPLNTSFKHYPLINEIVLLVSAPDIGQITESGDKLIQRQANSRTYYSTIVNSWNLVNHNSSPSHYENKLELGNNVEEKSINPLKPSPGDIILQGRLGQSVRMTGYAHINNPLINSTNNSSPLTVIRNGQQREIDKQKYINEDINKDDSSIYLCSDHIIPVKPVRRKQEGFTAKPKDQEFYKGRQVIIDSGRLVFNAKDDDILFTSKQNFGISSEIIGIDAKEYITLDAKKVYLGTAARQFEQQPVILGTQMEIFLASLLSSLESLGKACTTAADVSGAPIPSLNTEGHAVVAIMKSLAKQINPRGESLLKSKKVFTE